MTNTLQYLEMLRRSNISISISYFEIFCFCFFSIKRLKNIPSRNENINGIALMFYGLQILNQIIIPSIRQVVKLSFSEIIFFSFLGP
jgi:hypothetical protein